MQPRNQVWTSMHCLPLNGVPCLTGKFRHRKEPRRFSFGGVQRPYLPHSPGFSNMMTSRWMNFIVTLMRFQTA